MAKGKGLFAAIGAGTAISAVAGAYKFSEFAVKAKALHEVQHENEVFVRLLERVHSDLIETRRLVKLPAVEFALSKAPEKVAWINSVMKSTRHALELMEPYTENVQEDTADGGHVGIRHRFKWVLDEKHKLTAHNLELVACHQSLTQVLGFLAAMEPLACCEEEQGQQQQGQQRTTREIDFKIEGQRGPQKEIRFEREVRREGDPRAWNATREVRGEIRRDGPPQEYQYKAEIRRDGPGAPQDFRYEADVRREGPPREFQFKREIIRDGGRGHGHEEWIEQRETVSFPVRSTMNQPANVKKSGPPRPKRLLHPRPARRPPHDHLATKPPINPPTGQTRD